MKKANETAEWFHLVENYVKKPESKRKHEKRKENFLTEVHFLIAPLRSPIHLPTWLDAA